MQRINYTRLVATGAIALGTLAAHASPTSSSLSLTPSTLSGKASVLNVSRIGGLDRFVVIAQQQQQQQQQQRSNLSMAAIAYELPSAGFTV